MRMVLKAKQIEHAKEGMHADGTGLYLRVQASGAKSWIFRFQLNGRRREMGIGTLDVKSAPDARADAATFIAQVRAGVDPIEARNRIEASQDSTRVMTFDEAAKQFIKANKTGWKNAKHADQWQNTLDAYASPVFGTRPVSEVDLSMVLQVLEPIWETKTETATRVRGRIENVLDWATVKGYRDGANPARWKGHLEHLMKSRKDMAAAGHKKATVRHHPALPYARVAAFMAALRAVPGSGARALELAILTAARSGEVRGTLWSEFDLDGKVWVIPKDRMKATREHRVPLSPAAVNLLEGLDRKGEHALVFIGERGRKIGDRGQTPISDMTITAVIRRMNEGEAGVVWTDPKTNAQIVPHGFRSTFRDWAAEQTDYSNEMVEMALAHAVGNKVEAAYRRGDMLEKRRDLMDAWAKYCAPKKQRTH
jgi:integrase